MYKSILRLQFPFDNLSATELIQKIWRPQSNSWSQTEIIQFTTFGNEFNT